MKARLVTFPLKGRTWCFCRTVDSFSADSIYNSTPSSLQEVWRALYSSSDKSPAATFQIFTDFICNKMNRAWINLEKAPDRTIKSKVYGIGQRLLSRVTPLEMFLKSISNQVSCVQVTYPSKFNERLVRRRLRHVATRGTIIHKRYFYGSISLVPLASIFAIVPLPNIPLFWILFRTYSHWKAFKGSQRLIVLISNDSGNQEEKGPSSLVMKPSEELQKMIGVWEEAGGAARTRAVAEICEKFELDVKHVSKYEEG